jgi:hypothetical protein
MTIGALPTGLACRRVFERQVIDGVNDVSAESIHRSFLVKLNLNI